MARAKRPNAELHVVVSDHLAGERWLPRPCLRYREDETIYLYNPTIDEKTKCECYKVLVRIPWLDERIRTAIRRHGLGESVQQIDNAIAQWRTQIYRNEVARCKAAGSKAPVKEVAARFGISVGALRQCLKPSRAKR
jgi:hypothetical protein